MKIIITPRIKLNSDLIRNFDFIDKHFLCLQNLPKFKNIKIKTKLFKCTGSFLYFILIKEFIMLNKCTISYNFLNYSIISLTKIKFYFYLE